MAVNRKPDEVLARSSDAIKKAVADSMYRSDPTAVDRITWRRIIIMVVATLRAEDLTKKKKRDDKLFSGSQ